MPQRRLAKAEYAQESDTRTRILDAAERLFAERGFHGVSLREITAQAHANTAAVHYYFRRKEDLLEAVVDRRAGIVVEERLKRIKAVLAGQPHSLEALILAYVTPGLTACFDSDELRKHFGRVRARFSQESDPAMRLILRRHFREPGIQFIEAAGKMMPHLARRELEWRFHIMIGALIYLMAHPGKVQAVGDRPDSYNPEDVHEALRYFVPMLAAIFRAPAASDVSFNAAMAEMTDAVARVNVDGSVPAAPDDATGGCLEDGISVERKSHDET